MNERDDELPPLAKSLFDAAREEIPSAEAEAAARRAVAAIPVREPTGASPKTGRLSPLALGALVLTAAIAYLALRDVSGTGDVAPHRGASVNAARDAAAESPSLASATPAASGSVLLLEFGALPSATASVSSSSPSSSNAVAWKPKPETRPRGSNEVDDPLALELSMIDRARSNLRAGDAAGALSELDAYRKRFPDGALKSEAMLVRVEALVAAGRRTEAETLARPLLQSRKDELVTKRLEKLLGP